MLKTLERIVVGTLWTTFTFLVLVALFVIGVSIWTNPPSADCGLGETYSKHTPVSSQAGCGPTGSASEVFVSSVKCGGAAVPGRGSAPADKSFDLAGPNGDQGSVSGGGTGCICYSPASQIETRSAVGYCCAQRTEGSGCFHVHIPQRKTGNQRQSACEPTIAATPPFSFDPGLYELRCEVDTVYEEIIGYFFQPPTYHRTIDTTCAWVRHECEIYDPFADTVFWYDADGRFLKSR